MRLGGLLDHHLFLTTFIIVVLGIVIVVPLLGFRVLLDLDRLPLQSLRRFGVVGAALFQSGAVSTDRVDVLRDQPLAHNLPVTASFALGRER